ncbi:hypothetical protein Tco_1030136 [Tanacetum coccineum]|uniref:Uncharacterized protein n=1 Tax=Tanacetum coccineum TaxID=301880 RepID=A0ABQ5G5C6_9ASTR
MTSLNHLSQGPGHEKLRELLNSYLEEHKKRRAIEACSGTQPKLDELEKELSNLVGLNELKLQFQKWAKKMLTDERRRALGLIESGNSKTTSYGLTWQSRNSVKSKKSKKFVTIVHPLKVFAVVDGIHC